MGGPAGDDVSLWIGLDEQRFQLAPGQVGEASFTPGLLSPLHTGHVCLRLVRHTGIAVLVNHILSADQIRSIRKRYTLTQAEFGRLLRLGANTLSRWESGRNVQTEAMDTLLRVIRDVPGSIDYLRSRAA